MTAPKKFVNGSPAVKVWIKRAMQRAMRKYRHTVNWSAFIRGAIARKLERLEKES